MISLGYAGVEVRVGENENQKIFFVHKNLIASRSEFFAKASSGKWKQAEDNMVDLHEDEPEVFGLYLQLVSTRTQPLRDHVKDRQRDAQEQ